MTGDQRYDLIAVALSQVGYHEGNSDADMDGQNYSGNRNFVEYTRLYGKLDNGEGNGTSYGYAWCAAFVSWCLRQARIPEDLVITEVSCPRFIKFLSSAGIYRTRESRYSPLPGDLIFFKNAGSTATSTHIGIVVGTSDGYVYTVEGNADDARPPCHAASPAATVGAVRPGRAVATAAAAIRPRERDERAAVAA
ncbi:MAG: CHAP domain-containing protein, partial [Treponema sp.]|nr:CHAP domain-containing protein [Treponema sp.]